MYWQVLAEFTGRVTVEQVDDIGYGLSHYGAALSVNTDFQGGDVLMSVPAPDFDRARERADEDLYYAAGQAGAAVEWRFLYVMAEKEYEKMGNA